MRNDFVFVVIRLSINTRSAELINEIIMMYKIFRKKSLKDSVDKALSRMAKLKTIIPIISEKVDSYTINSFLCAARSVTDGMAIALLITPIGME